MCLAVVCRAVLLGAFVLAGFAAESAFETASAADTGCERADAGPAPTECPLASVALDAADPAPRIVPSPVAVSTTRPVTESLSLVNAAVRQTTAAVGSAAPRLAPAIKKVDSALTAATTATAQTVDTVVRDTVTAAGRTLDNPITHALTGTVSGAVATISPVVTSTGLSPRVTAAGVVTVTATASSLPSADYPQPAPHAAGAPAAVAPQAPAVD
ncbi:hypothetical protein, partial [Amycolatopsis sp. SID8362]|uniref:hypothetical protein n=1 Tax=Amycolatopsis sp. SID8362 TaxID=2690346 RepID=UPI00142C8831